MRKKHFNERLDVVKYSLSKNKAEESELKSNLQQQEQLATDIKDKIDQVQSEIKQKEQILADFDSELSSINENEQALQTKLAVVQSKHESELSQNNDLKENSISLEQQVAEAETRLKDLDSEKDKLQLSNSEVKKKLVN
jgi:hypothetical protein